MTRRAVDPRVTLVEIYDTADAPTFVGVNMNRQYAELRVSRGEGEEWRLVELHLSRADALQLADEIRAAAACPG